MRPMTPVVSVLLVKFTVLPNRQYLGILLPITPVTTSPECIPMVIYKKTKANHSPLSSFSTYKHNEKIAILFPKIYSKDVYYCKTIIDKKIWKYERQRYFYDFLTQRRH